MSSAPKTEPGLSMAPPEALVDQADFLRLDASRRLDPKRQADHRDGVAGIQLHDPRVHTPGLLDLVDGEESVGLQELLDHASRLPDTGALSLDVRVFRELVTDETGPRQEGQRSVEGGILDDVPEQALEDDADGRAFRDAQRVAKVPPIDGQLRE